MTSIDSKKIANLPDQMIDAGKVRELANLHRKWGEEGSWAPKTINIHTQIAVVLESLLPTSSRPTLDDLIEQGHDPRQYVGMQCEVEGEVKAMILLARDGLGGDSWLLASKLGYSWKMPRTITPLPDLPRLVWPDEFSQEPAEDSSTPEVAPKVLLTEEDYREAPNRTIVAEVGGVPFYASAWAWQTLDGGMYSHCDLAGFPRHVIRWGMGEQA